MEHRHLRLLTDLHDCAAWSGDPTHPICRQLLAELAAPDAADLASSYLESGLAAHDAIATAYEMTRAHGTDHPTAAASLESLAALTNEQKKMGHRAAAMGQRDYELTQWEQSRLADGLPLSTLKSSPSPHCIDQLEPASSWTLFVMNNVGQSPTHGPCPHSLLSRLQQASVPADVVGILLPSEYDLSSNSLRQPADTPPAAREDLTIQRLVDSPIGALGLHMSAQPLETIGELVRCVLRLLPLAGPTQLTVVSFDARSGEPTDEATVADSLLRQLLLVDPARCCLISIVPAVCEQSASSCEPAANQSLASLSSEAIAARFEELKRDLDWENTTGSARRWWLAFEQENAHRPSLLLRVAEELKMRRATITEFFVSFVYANTDSLPAVLKHIDAKRSDVEHWARSRAHLVDSARSLLTSLLRAWRGRSASDRARLAQSQLAPCLVETDCQVLRSAWDALEADSEVPAREWFELCGNACASRLTSNLLDRIAGQTRQRVHLWESYHRQLASELDGKAIPFEKVGPAVAWLERNQPESREAIRPDLKLAWLVTQLTVGNAAGETDSELERRIAALTATLYYENARLVCLADLHLAVRDTNRLEFARASQRLGRWRDVPLEVPGRQMFGRVHSSLGQHLAFQGRFAEARQFFRIALDEFARLSDDQLAESEWRQTATYHALAAIDDPHLDADSARALVEEVVDLSPLGIGDMAATASRHEQYLHHLLLRYLVYRGTPNEVRSYVGARRRWRCLSGHPWELVQTYRAILLQREGDLSGARDLLLRARNMCLTSGMGPTLQLIGATIGAVGVSWGIAWAQARSVLAQVEDALPHVRDRLETVRHALDHPGSGSPGEDLLAKVLPFSFH